MSTWHKALVAGVAYMTLAGINAAPAQTLSAHGPVSPDNGFPAWYRDAAGTQLDLCLANPNLCLLTQAVQLLSPGQPFPLNYGGTFPDESFYWAGDAIMPTNGGGSAILVMAIHAGFVNGGVAPGEQVVFGRMRIRADNAVAGASYHVTTPYGTFDIVATGSGRRGINFTQDIGLVAGAFNEALNAGIGPFLRWNSGLPIQDGLGNTFIGDPNVEHAVTGSPFGTNFFRIDGPSIGGPGVNTVSTNLFTVTGMNSLTVTPPPVAAFQGAPTSGVAPLTVNFTDLSTGSVTGRTWNFGDGSQSAAANPSHVYSAPGSYTVSLAVSGVGGSNTATIANMITVTAPPTPPVADFTALPVSGQVPLNVAFTDTSTGDITSRVWSFGDGANSIAANPSHVYTAAGNYTVSLTVNGPGGSNTKTVPAMIAVAAPPTLTLAAPQPGIAPGRNVFTATNATPGAEIYVLWSTADGAGQVRLRNCTLITGLANPLVLCKAKAVNSTIRWTVNMNRSLAGQTLRLQAVDTGNCSLSNVVVETF